MATMQGKTAHMQACIKINLMWTCAVQNSVNINIVHALQKLKHDEILPKQLVYTKLLDSRLHSTATKSIQAQLSPKKFWTAIAMSRQSY